MRFLSRWLSATTIRVEGRKVTCLKGKVSDRCLGELAAIARREGIGNLELWLSGNGRVESSHKIPERVQQQIRNVLFGADST